MTHEEISELLGAYALDAVEGDEAVAIAAHLEACPRCRDEVARYQQVAAMLANTGADAPSSTWHLIAGRLSRPVAGEQLPDVAPSEMPDLGASATEVGRPAPIVSLAERRGRMQRRALVALSAAAAAAIIAVAVLGVDVGRLNHRVNHMAAVSQSGDVTTAARNALLDPSSRRIVLDSTSNSSTRLAEVVTTSSGAAYLINSRLGGLPSRQTYQLWALVGGRAISMGLLGAHPTTSAFTLSPADPADTFAITVEPAAGSETPTSPPVASASA
jgi:anti-sigma-K factor RskA